MTRKGLDVTDSTMHAIKTKCKIFAALTTLALCGTQMQAPVNKLKEDCVSIDGVAAKIFSFEAFPC